jgi:hypothetical protein
MIGFAVSFLHSTLNYSFVLSCILLVLIFTSYSSETPVRYQSTGRSRRTKMEYTTTVIEAIGVEHKETTR